MPLALTWPQALAWRMERHLLDPLGKVSVEDVVGFDQWVLGPGTDDGHVVPAARRRAVSKQAGWIAPVVVVGGVVRGTWELKGDRVAVAWFKEAGKPPKRALAAEVARLSATLGRKLTVAVSLT